MVYRNGNGIGVREVNRHAAPVFIYGLAESLHTSGFVLVGAYNRADARRIGGLDLNCRAS